MKVNFVGNVCNHHYLVAKFLRQLGVDAHLYYFSSGHYQTFPESDDPDHDPRDRQWMHPFDRPYFHLGPRHWIGADFIREISRCDLLEAQGPELIYAFRTGRPYIWHPYGDDLADMPFWTRFMRREPRTGIRLPDPRHSLTARWMVRAIKGAAAIISAWEDSNNTRGYRLLRDLGCGNRLVQLPLVIDVSKFASKWERSVYSIRRRLLPDRPRDEFVIFHPTRQAFSSAAMFGKKGNDRLYRALARLKHEDFSFTLVVVDKEDPDVSTAKKLIRKLGLAENVVWVRQMPRHQLVQWYMAADVTADQFVVGAPGSVFIESMSCGTPVLIYIKTTPDEWFGLSPESVCGELPPLLNARSEEQIYTVLRSSMLDRDKLAHLGRSCREFALKHFSGEVVAGRYLDLYERLLSQSNV